MILLIGIMKGDGLSTDTDIFLNEILEFAMTDGYHSFVTVINTEITKPTAIMKTM